MNEALEILETVRALGADIVPDLKIKPASRVPDELAARASAHADEIRALLLAETAPERPKVPAIEIQLQNFSFWQSSKSAGYFLWPPAAMDALRAKLIELGEGVELIPCFALSVQVRLRDGKMILLDRGGKETKG